MNYSAITPKRKVEIATSVLLLQNYGFTLGEIKGIDLNSSSDNEIYLMFDDIYSDLGNSLELQVELQESEIYSTSDLIEFICKTQ